MAVMIPEKPRNFDSASQEGLMFDALSLLSDEYCVFHSLRITNVNQNVLHESETDFVIFSKKKGIICLEAKAGQVRYEGGEWLYGNGIPMSHDGPFNQASANKYKLMKYIETSSAAPVLKSCKFLHAVWFPAITETTLRTMHFPTEADKRLVLTKEALTEPERFLNNIFDIELPNGKQTDISDAMANKLVKEVLCPQFNVFPSASFDADLKKIVFHRLLNEQAGILNFLGEQKTAAINGAAGTGKTMIAVEKARRHAAENEKVLFLCYNVKLKEYLQSNYANEHISFFTIDGFACSLCGGAAPDYPKAKEKLEELYISCGFPYKHIIIDEGQDFGVNAIEEADIIGQLLDIVTDETVDGTFYVFYDRLQMIQASQMPRFIQDLDCRLTLYRNCRNTENIALTSLRPISEREPKMFEGAIKGAPAKIHFCVDPEDVKNRVDAALASARAEGLSSIAVLTCRTESTSMLSPYVKNGKYLDKYTYSTCRKYKGLEADAVLLVDADREVFEQKPLLYYVGASRARLRLDVFTTVSDEDCRVILQDVLHYNKKISKAKKDFAGALNAVGSLKD